MLAPACLHAHLKVNDVGLHSAAVAHEVKVTARALGRLGAARPENVCTVLLAVLRQYVGVVAVLPKACLPVVCPGELEAVPGYALRGVHGRTQRNERVQFKITEEANHWPDAYK